MDPKYSVSVIIPSFNDQDYISDAINSALSQTMPPNEIIVVDDGLSDKTKEIVSAFKNKVRYIPQSHKNLAAARNTGILSSTSKWIAFLDSDDLWVPEHLQNVINVIIRNNLEWGYGGIINVNYKKGVLPDIFLKHKIILSEGMLINNYYRATNIPALIPSGVIISKKALEEIGCFDETFNYVEDTEMFLRLTYRYPQVGCVDGTVIRRLRPGSLSQYDSNRYLDILKKHQSLILNSKRKDLTFVLPFLTQAAIRYFFDKRDKTSLRKALKDYGYLLNSPKSQRVLLIATYSMWFAHILFMISEIKHSLLRLIKGNK